MKRYKSGGLPHITIYFYGSSAPAKTEGIIVDDSGLLQFFPISPIEFAVLGMVLFGGEN